MGWTLPCNKTVYQPLTPVGQMGPKAVARLEQVFLATAEWIRGSSCLGQGVGPASTKMV